MTSHGLLVTPQARIFLADNTSKETRKFRFREFVRARYPYGEVYEVDCYRNSFFVLTTKRQ